MKFLIFTGPDHNTGYMYKIFANIKNITHVRDHEYAHYYQTVIELNDDRSLIIWDHEKNFNGQYILKFINSEDKIRTIICKSIKQDKGNDYQLTVDDWIKQAMKGGS